MLQIRRTKPEDIGFIMEIASKNGCPAEKLLSHIEGFLVCEVDGVKCGCGCIILKENKGFMSWVIVSDGHRRKKLGSAIVKALLNIADLKGVKEVYAANVCGEFLEAMGFYKEDGKKGIEDMEDVFGSINISEYYRVSLEGYFKPCSQ